jgi:hypothetical protein
MRPRSKHPNIDRAHLLARARLVEGLARRGVPVSDALVALGLTARSFGAVARQLEPRENLPDEQFLSLLDAEDAELRALVAEHSGNAAALRAAIRSCVRKKV